jgi:hypothetical protein
MSQTKKTKIVDVVLVNRAMWAEGVNGARVNGWGSCYQAKDQS